jgi:hypothetical protein
MPNRRRRAERDMVDGEEEAEPLTLYVFLVRAAARGIRGILILLMGGGLSVIWLMDGRGRDGAFVRMLIKQYDEFET